MLAMNPTLLVGPSDWDPGRMPQEEFAARADALWRDNPSATGAIVYGDRVNHAELAYLTNFTPKLEAALALIPRDGLPQLLVGGGVNMLPAARPLTFVADLRPLRNVGKTVAEWARAQGGGTPVLIGSTLMPYVFHQEIAAALGSKMGDKTAELRRLMGRKSARELAELRQTCATLDAAVAAMRAAQRSGAGVTAAVLAGEQANVPAKVEVDDDFYLPSHGWSVLTFCLLVVVLLLAVLPSRLVAVAVGCSGLAARYCPLALRSCESCVDSS